MNTSSIKNLTQKYGAIYPELYDSDLIRDEVLLIKNSFEATLKFKSTIKIN